MEEMKKRKLEDITQFIPNLNETPSFCTVEELRALLDPLAKPQLVDLLSKAGSQYPSIAEDIKSVASADPALRKLFVRGLAWNTTSETLCAAFQEHGEIEEGAVIYDKATGKSRGYGFITYKDMQSAQEALKAPSKMIDGRMAACNLASEGLNSSAVVTSDQSQRKLYVGGLSPETTSEMLLSFFRKHGEIEEGSVAYDKDSNKSRGFGFVTYNTVEAAVKAINDPQKILGGRNITVKLADNHKGKGSQQQMQAAMGQVPFHMSGGYHQHKPYPGYGYGYPQYPNSAYSNSATQSPYAAQSQYPYPQYGGSRETTPSHMGLLAQYGVDRETPPSQMGNGGYPYHMPK